MRALIASLSISLLFACDSGGTAVDPDGAVEADGAATTPDAGTPDSAGPMANVYRVNPVEDKKTTTQVELQHLTDKEGKLTGRYADVWNCLNEDGGEKIDVEFGGMKLSGKMCHQVQKSRPGPDGTYLHIKPPADESDGSDAFAGIMMYHHVTTIHDHYYKTFGITHLKDKKMRALVNVQAFVTLFGGWVGMLNAAYVPKETGSMFKQFGVDLNKGEDAIIFSQDTMSSSVDTAYDAAVIYHEYTHAAIGAAALWSTAPDRYGTDPTPRALNEALADYLPASYLDTSTVGTYTLAAVNAARDLDRDFKCPDHMIGEEHYDGEVASGALWDMRKLVGKEVADQAIWNALVTFNIDTTFEQAAKAILDEVKQLKPDAVAQVKQLFEDRGLIGCVRLKDHVNFEGQSNAPHYPDPLPASFPDGTPAFIQYRVEILDTTKEVTIEYTPSAGSMMGLPVGGGKGDVWVALRKGSDPITYEYGGGKTVSTAHAVLEGEDDGNGFKLVLSGDCIAKGDLVFQFVNKGTAGGTLTKVKVTQSDTVTNTQDTFTGCE